LKLALESSHGIRLSRRSFIKGGIAATALTAVVVGVLPQRISGTTPVTPSASTAPSPGLLAIRTITLRVNGQSLAAQVEPRDMLVNVLREQLGLIGTKRPCNRMECGGCTVLIDNKPFYSCTYLAIRAQGHQILTPEGGKTDAVLAAVQNAWVQTDASQCGYCQGGQVMSATALLKSNNNPSVDEIKAGMSGNLCRCGTYMNIIEGVQLASENLRGV